MYTLNVVFFLLVGTKSMLQLSHTFLSLAM